jgi:hypothetical protein
MKTVLTYSKSTKNTHVYKNDEEGAPIPSLYIKHAALPSKPAKIDITITPVDE